jgi:class 3 adenylate cyclase
LKVAVQCCKAALAIRDFMKNHAAKNKDKAGLKQIRIGLHCGAVVAGVVGSKKFAYDIWGDTVNIAARMEQNCEAGQVNISHAIFQQVQNEFQTIYRGKIKAKNKGEMDMYSIESSA